MQPGCTQNGARNRVQLRSISLLNIFLHRAAHLGRRLEDTCDYKLGVDFRPLGGCNGCGFVDTGLPLLKSFEITGDAADRQTSRGGGKCRIAAFDRAAAMTWTEILGFVTGAASVLAAVRESAWNWPVGIANNVFFVFFLVLFWKTRL